MNRRDAIGRLAGACLLGQLPQLTTRKPVVQTLTITVSGLAELRGLVSHIQISAPGSGYLPPGNLYFKGKEK